MIEGDPRPGVDDAMRIGRRCLEINPRDHLLLDNLAQAQLALAHYLIETGDPMPALAAAHGYLDRAEAVENNPAQVWHHRLVAAGIEAAFRLRGDHNPTSAIETGRRALMEAVQMHSFADYYVEATRLDLIEAAWAERTRRESAPALEKARANAKNAVALDERSAEAKEIAAEVYLQIARTQRSCAVIEQGKQYAREALTLNRRLARAKTVAAALKQLPCKP
jgi:serine/threonine-protein kinase